MWREYVSSLIYSCESEFRHVTLSHTDIQLGKIYYWGIVCSVWEVERLQQTLPHPSDLVLPIKFIVRIKLLLNSWSIYTLVFIVYNVYVWSCSSLISGILLFKVTKICFTFPNLLYSLTSLIFWVWYASLDFLTELFVFSAYCLPLIYFSWKLNSFII